MPKFKIGDKVRVIETDVIRSGCAQEGEIGIVDEEHSTPWCGRSDGTRFAAHQDNLELVSPVVRTLNDLEVGDIVIDKFHAERAILERLPNSVLLSLVSELDEVYDWRTIAELKKEGFTLKQPELITPTPIKMTVTEIAKKLGYEVEIIKG